MEPHKIRKQLRLGVLLCALVIIFLSLNLTAEATDWSDNFNDGDISDWTTESGTFSAASNYLECTSSGGIFKTSSNTNGSWLFDLWEDYWFGVDQHVFFMSTLQQPNMTYGYSISLEYGGDSNVTLYRWENNVQTVLGRTNINNGTQGWTSYNVSRTSDGQFEVRRNGTVYISATDNIVTQSNYFVYRVYGSGRGLDNIGISQLPPPVTITTTTTTTTTTTSTTDSTTTTLPTEEPGISPIDGIVRVIFATMIFVGIPAAIMETAFTAVASAAYRTVPSVSITRIARIDRTVSISYTATHQKDKKFKFTIYIHDKGANLKIHRKHKQIDYVGVDEERQDFVEFQDGKEIRIFLSCELLQFKGGNIEIVPISKEEEVVSRTFIGTPTGSGKTKLEVEFREVGAPRDIPPITELTMDLLIVEPPVKFFGRKIPSWLVRLVILAQPIISLFLYIGTLFFGFDTPSNFGDYSILFNPFVAMVICFILLIPNCYINYKILNKEFKKQRA